MLRHTSGADPAENNDGYGHSPLPPRTDYYLAFGAQKKHRNEELFHAANQMRDAGWSYDEAAPKLTARALADGLKQTEINDTLNSAYSRPKREPVASGVSGYSNNGSAAPKHKTSMKLPKPMADGLAALIEAAYKPGELVSITPITLRDEKRAPYSKETQTLAYERWMTKLKKASIETMMPKQDGGILVRINQMNGNTDDDVIDYRHCLVENDILPKEQQYAALVESNVPIRVLLDSGNRSLQALIVLDAPDLAEYERRRDIVWKYFAKWQMDAQNANPSRYCRCPGVERKVYDDDGVYLRTVRQELLAVHLGAKSWADWEKEIGEQWSQSDLDTLSAESVSHLKLFDRPFPEPMADAAFIGLPGEIIDIMSDSSESCRESLLMQLLVMQGNVLARGCSIKQADYHPTNEFLALVGATAAGKGAGFAPVRALYVTVAPEWAKNRIRGGLQSGEGIINEVRDARTVVSHKGSRVVPGVGDKRLLIYEPEFAQILTVDSRKGNTVLIILRRAWDAEDILYTVSKENPQQSTGAHVSLIAHVTPTEFLSCISHVAMVNGVCNRFLWCATWLVKYLAVPKWIDWTTHPKLIARLGAAIQTFLDIPRDMTWSKPGKKAWTDWCHKKPPYSDSTIIGPVIARRRPHVLRLTEIYASFDNTALMTEKHLAAAIAVWDYSVASAHWLFGNKTNNKTADKILWALQHAPNGLTRSEVMIEVFGRNISKVTLDQSFAVLLDAGLVSCTHDKCPKGQRPPERWRAA